jgi:hypothetical protein
LAIYCCAQPERKFQIWNKNEIEINLWEKITIEVAEKIHFSPETNATDIKYGELFVSHDPLKWFEYGAGFRATYKNTYPGWLTEYRPMVLANFKKSHKEFFFKYSNRLEYRIFEFDVNHFRYRQEFFVEFPALTSWGMRFYSSEEAFFKLNGAGFHLARFYEGLSVIQKEHFKLKLYYALEKMKLVENWGTTDVAGINLSFII